MSDQIAPRTSEQAADFMIRQHEIGARWSQMCLSLQRTARGLPAVYPSALSAAMATPLSERVMRVSDLRRGMVAYSDDPNDSNKFGHIYFIAGWSGSKDSLDNLLTWTNVVGGAVEIVPITYYRANWGDSFQFGATWLNGYDFAEFDKPPKPVKGRETLGDNFEHAIEDIKKAIKSQERQAEKGSPAERKAHQHLANMLKKDLERMRERYKGLRKPQ